MKPGDGNNSPRYKDHIVVKCIQQKKGVDFDEIFASVVKMTSIQTLLSITANMDLEVEQLNVKTTFLHGDIEEEIYMQRIRQKGKGEHGIPVEEESLRIEVGSR